MLSLCRKTVLESGPRGMKIGRGGQFGEEVGGLSVLDTICLIYAPRSHYLQGILKWTPVGRRNLNFSGFLMDKKWRI